MAKVLSMEKAQQLLGDYERYKNEADAFHYQLNARYRTVDEVSQALADLRSLCEGALPSLAVRAAGLSSGEIFWLFSDYQSLPIDDYGLRLGIFDLIPNPTEDLIQKVQNFKRTVEII